MRLIHGDCLDALATLPDCSVDAVVTDPPAGIAFMGKHWDGDKGGRDLWIAWLAERLAECLRVLKPGGHAVVWALPRTSGWTHRALEDAGFDVRDCVHHLFGSGFPKSLDVGKAIDKARCQAGDPQRVCGWIADRCDALGLGRKDLDTAAGTSDMGGWWASRLPHRCQIPTLEQWQAIEPLLGPPPEWLSALLMPARRPGEAFEQRDVLGSRTGAQAESTGRYGAWGKDDGTGRSLYDVTAPATAEAQQWDGWGTALKPAVEHWWLARKPLDSTVAGTVTRWGTGAINIDATRVGTDTSRGDRYNGKAPAGGGPDWQYGHAEPWDVKPGRWPADVVLTHSPACDEGVCVPGCAVAELDKQSGDRPGCHDQEHRSKSVSHVVGVGNIPGQYSGRNDSGGASRFFPTFRYQAKPSTREKSVGLDDRNHHPTCKPVELMRWLIRLVTPPGGTVLDCFAGSGTTGVAATLEGFDCVLIEAEQEYLPLIEGRVRWAEGQAEQVTLAFD